MRIRHDDELCARFRSLRIGVLMGGMSSERDISMQTGTAIRAALERRGYQTRAIDVTPRIAEDVRRDGIEVAFLALHGPYGEDGTIQGMLEIMGIPYTGSGVLASAIAINKAMTKKIFSYHGLPTPAFEVLPVRDGLCSGRIGLKPPFVVKPVEGGSTIGISIVRSRSELESALAAAARYDREVLIEAYVQGRELTAAVLDGEALPLVEIRPASGFYDYTAKYRSEGTTQYIVAPELPGDAAERVQRLAVAAFDAVGCSGAARIDVMLDDGGNPLLLEVNTIPGMTASSLLPKAAQHAGIDFEHLVERILWGARLHKQMHPASAKVAL